jgi:predicted transcriptional regulator
MREGLTMSEVMISVSETARQRLQELAEQSGRSITEVLERAVEAYHNRQFWEAVDKGYAELRADPEAWAAEEAERRAWDGTLMDGLDPSECWGDDGAPLPPAGEGQPS